MCVYCTAIYTVIVIIIIINARLLTHVNSIFECDRSVHRYMLPNERCLLTTGFLRFINIYIKLSSLWWFIHVSLISLRSQCTNLSNVWNSLFFSFSSLMSNFMERFKRKYFVHCFFLYFLICYLTVGKRWFSAFFSWLLCISIPENWRRFSPIRRTYSLVREERGTLIDWVRTREREREIWHWMKFD